MSPSPAWGRGRGSVCERAEHASCVALGNSPTISEPTFHVHKNGAPRDLLLTGFSVMVSDAEHLAPDNECKQLPTGLEQ